MRKKCIKCQMNRDIKYFCKKSANRSGYRARCKDCSKIAYIGLYISDETVSPSLYRSIKESIFTADEVCVLL